MTIKITYPSARTIDDDAIELMFVDAVSSGYVAADSEAMGDVTLMAEYLEHAGLIVVDRLQITDTGDGHELR
jgi:hypothetical protein